MNAKTFAIATGFTVLISLTTSVSQAQLPDAPTQAVDRHWDGLNPFAAPARTTDYYGSGDVDLDGQVTTTDLRLAQEMVDNTRRPNIRADVDGDGFLTTNDLALLTEAVQRGSILPGWWNRLTTSAAREQWMDRIAALDYQQMVLKSEASRGWVCLNYALRSFLRFAPAIQDPSGSAYGAYGISQATFNLPLYTISVTLETATKTNSHTMNAILTGEDPTILTNWYFLEPQEGIRVRPGQQSLIANAKVDVLAPDPINTPSLTSSNLLRFSVAPAALLTCSSNFLTRRPPADSAAIHSKPNVWQAHVLSGVGGGKLLLSKSRDDSTRVTDVHLLSSPDAPLTDAKPLCNLDGFSLLLDTVPAPSNSYHMLWVGHTNWQSAIFYGKLDLSSGQIRNYRLVTTNYQNGQLLSVNSNEVDVYCPSPSNLVCFRNQNDQWNDSENVLTWNVNGPSNSWPCFGLTTTSNQEPRLIWAETTNGQSTTTLFERQRKQVWQLTTPIQTVSGFIQNLHVSRDRRGNTHLVYAASTKRSPCSSCSQNRALWQIPCGYIFYQTNSANRWSAPIEIAQESFWPTICVTELDLVVLSWVSDINGTVVPMWMNFTQGTSATNCATQGIPNYPQLAETTSGAVALTWTESSQLGNILKSQVLVPREPITLKVAFGQNYNTLTWTATRPGIFQAEIKILDLDKQGNLTQAKWQETGSPATTTNNNGQVTLMAPKSPSRRMVLYRIKRI